jgi:2-dehydropantoate 2-reductase
MSSRFVIYGAGAVGGVIGGLLAVAGHDVALIARGTHLAALQRRGLELRMPDETHLLTVPAVGHPGELELTDDDVVILAMKTQHTEAALDELAGCAPPGIAVACAQNGVDNERMALRRFANVYGICVYLPASHLEPGVVEGAGAPVGGVLDVGRYPGGNDERAGRIAAALTASGFRSQADPRVMRFKYAKLRQNTGNALDAACGRAGRQSALAAQAAAEALAVYRAAGIEVATREEEAERRGDFHIVDSESRRRTGSSSWQSLARGSGSIEADYLNGEIVLLGRQQGVPTPANEILRQLANRMARDRRAPGTVTMAELDALSAEPRPGRLTEP